MTRNIKICHLIVVNDACFSGSIFSAKPVGKTKQRNFIAVREAQENEVKILLNRFCKSEDLTDKKMYILYDVLVYGINKCFLQVVRYFVEPAKQAKVKTSFLRYKVTSCPNIGDIYTRFARYLHTTRCS